MGKIVDGAAYAFGALVVFSTWTWVERRVTEHQVERANVQSLGMSVQEELLWKHGPSLHSPDQQQQYEELVAQFGEYPR